MVNMLREQERVAPRISTPNIRIAMPQQASTISGSAERPVHHVHPSPWLHRRKQGGTVQRRLVLLHHRADASHPRSW